MPRNTVHLVRHAQGFHQLPQEHPNTAIPDPELTPYGIEQCQHLCSTFPYHSRVTLLCASPMRRAIRTALLSFEPVVQRGLTVVALPDAQETTDAPSDTGSSIEDLKGVFGPLVDYRFMTDSWFEKTGRNAVDIEALRARARSARRWLRAQDQRDLVLITHGAFAHYLTGHIDEMGEQTGAYWYNVRWRSFNFLGEEDDEATLVETKESKQRAEDGDADENPNRK